MHRLDYFMIVSKQPQIYLISPPQIKLDDFFKGINALRKKGNWTKDDIVKLYFGILPNFSHKETGKYLDQRM